VPNENLSLLMTELARVKGHLEPGQICALNQDRESFLGLRVISGDFPLASLLDWMTTLTPNSGTGIWMNPFRGIAAEDVRAPMDLLYLDADCRVIAAVEFFPTYRVSPSSATATSVLALPTHSIFSSHTQPGDQLVLCPADEMEWRLERMAQNGTMGGIYPAQANPGLRPVLVRDEPRAPVRPVVVREMPIRAVDPVPAAPVAQIPVVREEAKAAPVAQEAAPYPVAQYSIAEPKPQAPIRLEEVAPEKPWMDASRAPAKKPLGFFGKWLFPDRPDPRKMSRLPVEGLVAHFFTGGAPQPHEIRDMSLTGLYVVTTERWYPGTLIRMTLTRTDAGQSLSDRSITVQSKSVRWGNDGVGLEFVFAPPKSKRDPRLPLDTVDSAELTAFLKRAVNPKR
jgi:hypothetical protein